MARQISGPAAGHNGQPHQRAGFAQSVAGILALLCFIALFVIGFFGEVFLPAGSEWLYPLLFGSMFLFAGLAVGIGGQRAGYLFAGIGFLVAAVPCVYIMSGDATRELLLEKAVPCLLLSVFVIVGLLFMAVPPVANRRKERIYTYEVQAKVIDKHVWFMENHDGVRHRTWTLDWEYYVSGDRHVYKSHTGRSPEKREPGDRGVLYLNPDDASDVWEKPGAWVSIAMFMLGFCFFVCGAVAMFLFLS